MQKLTQVCARDYVTEAKTFGIFTLYFTTSNCGLDKRLWRGKAKQVGWNRKQDCSIWHSNDQLFCNKPLHFWGGLFIILLYKWMNLYLCFPLAASSIIFSCSYSKKCRWYYVYEVKCLQCHFIITQNKATESHQQMLFWLFLWHILLNLSVWFFNYCSKRK